MSEDAGATPFRATVHYQALLLGLFALGSAALLATGNLGTEEAIRQRTAEDLEASLSQVVPSAFHDNSLLDDTLSIHDDKGDRKVYRGLKDGKVVALALESVGYGYSGAIKIIMGVDSTGKVLGVRVLSHAETPGLGDKIEIAKAKWITSFDGRSLGDPPVEKWKVKKDGGIYDQFSGATITPRAVVKAVKDGLEFFVAHQAELTAAPTSGGAPAGPAPAAEPAPAATPEVKGESQ